MQKWEYKVILLQCGTLGNFSVRDTEGGWTSLEEVLNKQGQDGWEYLGSITDQITVQFSQVSIIFKRPASELGGIVG